MADSRREFLKKSAMVLAAMGVPVELNRIVNAQSPVRGVSDLSSIPAASLTDSLMYLKQSSFEPYINSIFQLSRGRSETFEVGLVKVSGRSFRQGAAKGPRSVRPAVVMDDRFSLLFKSETQSLPQDVYDVRHAALGEFRLLMVPVINRDTTAYYLEAIINRAF